MNLNTQIDTDYIIRTDGHNTPSIGTRDAALEEFELLKGQRRYTHLELGLRYRAANGEQRFVTFRRWRK